MQPKVIFDGALFSECFFAGENRYGMLRVAEEISNQIIHNNHIEIAFANTIQLPKYYDGLNEYLNQIGIKKSINNLSVKPNNLLRVLEKKNLYFRLLKFLPLSARVNNVNQYNIFHSFYYPIPDSLQTKNIRKSITFLDIIPLKENGYSRSIVERTKNIVKDVKENFSFAISEYSKQDILNYDSSINPEKIFVAPLAASSKIFYCNKNETDWNSVKTKYNLPSNYFLSISSNDKRKNIPHVIKSFNKFILQNKVDDIHLLLIGNYKFSGLNLDEMKIDKTVQKKIVIPEHFIDNKDLAVIYSNAICFLFMSLYEGFGLPALEAMQCSSPVIASNVTSIPEVVGNAGILISPTDDDLLAQQLTNLYFNRNLISEMSLKSQVQAAKFSWESCAKIYENTFNSMINSY